MNLGVLCSNWQDVPLIAWEVVNWALDEVASLRHRGGQEQRQRPSVGCGRLVAFPFLGANAAFLSRGKATTRA